MGLLHRGNRGLTDCPIQHQMSVQILDGITVLQLLGP